MMAICGGGGRSSADWDDREPGRGGPRGGVPGGRFSAGAADRPRTGMIAIPAGVRIAVASRPVDFRNGLDGLAALVQQALRENPFAGDLFVFRAKRAAPVQILVWC